MHACRSVGSGLAECVVRYMLFVLRFAGMRHVELKRLIRIGELAIYFNSSYARAREREMERDVWTLLRHICMHAILNGAV